ncbi:MAG: hypothetical protein QT08_C0016G0017 [archaeon GW2011_AR17]|nr:MAG: hypothetical protein QT08_C0016G0017 [archaeon GW2011_AR17]MBS3154697.1 eight-cysteine-cluster domain-containing protein [Candidatus Woesearchaeota archaeon]HIH14978.1 eight-cysteine-cluster domain-containing protein [Nanoarchaeota archaeon]HIH58783.1 eight-cysteine-cluster domain-containing protein [Nanoarchaeota archaeon]HII13514.1 eight-cysteine-cluster domain-containing protein [Nanoarchaeota archaeon]
MKALFLGCLLILLTITSCTVQEDTSTDEERSEAFCGTSSKGSCTADSECRSGGCSGQICQAATEEERITTCEYKDCYNAEDYSLSCSCVENQCLWA